MMRHLSLRGLGTAMMLAAFVAGLLASWMWMQSVLSWQSYLNRANAAGMSLYSALTQGTATPQGIVVTPVRSAPSGNNDAPTQKDFAELAGLTGLTHMAQLSIRDDKYGEFSADLGLPMMRLVVVSDRVPYAVSALNPSAGRPAPDKLGHVVRLLATYCSHPVLFARVSDGPWLRAESTGVWNCEAQPRDLRLPAMLMGALALAILYTGMDEVTGRFGAFAARLRERRRLGGPESYPVQGPKELDAIVGAVNTYLGAEREQLSRRATVLSGVSHDLGTPATRLRLRARMIEDDELRARFDHDIDQMTGMIESVLTYTRSELSVEAPRQLSLTSLVEAAVADFQDMNMPVEMLPPEPAVIGGARSLFAARRQSRERVADFKAPERILVTARPLALSRAVTNLIDNALKYGRRAKVSVSADAETARIIVEDEGMHHRAADIETLVHPFRRGDTAGSIEGFGMGLTIVAAVAEQHGGTLHFADARHGIRAILDIRRS